MNQAYAGECFDSVTSPVASFTLAVGSLPEFIALGINVRWDRQRRSQLPALREEPVRGPDHFARNLEVRIGKDHRHEIEWQIEAFTVTVLDQMVEVEFGCAGWLSEQAKQPSPGRRID